MILERNIPHNGRHLTPVDRSIDAAHCNRRGLIELLPTRGPVGETGYVSPTLTIVTTVIASLSAVVASVTSAIVVIITRRQWAVMRKNAALDAIVPFHEKFQSKEFQILRDKFRRDDFNIANESDATIADARQFLNLLEFLGSMVEYGLIDVELVNLIFHGSVTEPWKYLKPYIDARRAREGKTAIPYAGSYEKLVNRYREKGLDIPRS